MTPAVSLPQPWAQLCVTRQHPRLWHPSQSDHPTVSRWLTFRHDPSRWAGQRIAIASTKQAPALAQVGDYRVHRNRRPAGSPFTLWQNARHLRHVPVCRDLPLGCVVGSAVLGQPLPIVAYDSRGAPDGVIEVTLSGLFSWDAHAADDISDQLPYADWTPGRWAVPLTDAAPITERCPWCDGEGVVGDSWREGSPTRPRTVQALCERCDGKGTADPFRVRGGPGVWQLTPERIP